jgi:hypothetical protein
MSHRSVVVASCRWMVIAAVLMVASVDGIPARGEPDQSASGKMMPRATKTPAWN